MKVRPATPDDRSELRRLRCALWPGHDAEALAAELDQLLGDSERAALWVAPRAGGGLAGFVEVSLRDVAEGCASSPVGYVEAWFVDPDARRRGVGRALVGAAEDWAAARGCSEIASDAALDNTPGQAAHRALGFAEVERAVHFAKKLRPAT